MPTSSRGVGRPAPRRAGPLAQLCARETARGTPRLLAHCAARDAIVAQVRQIRATLETAAPADEDAAEEAAEEAALLAARLRAFLECAHADTGAVAAIAPGEPPALAVVHRAPVRWLRRVFDTAKAAFLVSATLATPAARGEPERAAPRARDWPWRTGARSHQRARMGRSAAQALRCDGLPVRRPRSARPHPSRRRRAGVRPRPPRLRRAGESRPRGEAGGCWCCARATGSQGELAPRVRDAIAHAQGERLASRLDAFRADPNAVLLTPAAWTGLSLPGLVEHVVIPRIPSARPRSRTRPGADSSPSSGLPPRASSAFSPAIAQPPPKRTLAQGIGRGSRGPRERCTVWLLDPRFPLPKSMTRAIGGPGQGLAADHLALMYAIPARFRTGPRPAVDLGRIWPLARGASPTSPSMHLDSTMDNGA